MQAFANANESVARHLTEIDEVTAILDERGIEYESDPEGIVIADVLDIGEGYESGLSWWLKYGRVTPIIHEESGGIDSVGDLDNALGLLSTVATTEQIEALRDEARGHDPEQVSLCDAALEGDRGAYRRCVDVINEARGAGA